MDQSLRQLFQRLHIHSGLQAFDPNTKLFTIREGDKDREVPAEAVADIIISASPGDEKPAARAAEERSSGMLRLVYRDGSRVSVRELQNRVPFETRLILQFPFVSQARRAEIGRRGGRAYRAGSQ